jgi:3-hydroxyacyl-CoA dehydrogenase
MDAWGTMVNLDKAVDLRVDRHEGALILSLTETSTGLRSVDLDLIFQTLKEAAKDPQIIGVVLNLQGVQALKPQLAQSVAQTASQIESFPKPVIACLSGPTAGVIWALALAAHYRFAAPDVQIGMPEVRHGLLAGAGITQRLPRLIGAAETIRMLLGGRSELAPVLLAKGALDHVAEGDVLEAALAALAAGMTPRRTRDAQDGLRDAKRYLAEIRAFQERVTADPLDVSRAVVKTVEAALLLPFAEGLALEAVTLEDLAQAPETRALRHAIAAERAVRNRIRNMTSGFKSMPVLSLGRIGLWRAGPEAADLILSSLMRGLFVVAVDPVKEDLLPLLNRVAVLQEDLIGLKAITPETRDADWARLETSVDASVLANCDLVLTDKGDLPAGSVPVVGLGPVCELAGVVQLLPSPSAGGHAELSVPEIASQTPSVPLALELARQLGWRLHVVGPNGFVAPHLRQAQQAVTTCLIEMGHPGSEISAGMAAVGLGGGQSRVRKHVVGVAYEVGQLALAAVANEAARLLIEGIAPSAQELDAAALSAGLMPRWTGGPLFQAQQRGLILLRADLAKLGGKGRMAPCQVFDRMIAEGLQFYPQT